MTVFILFVSTTSTLNSPHNVAFLKLNFGASVIIEIQPPIHWYLVLNRKRSQFFTVYVDVLSEIDKSNLGTFFT